MATTQTVIAINDFGLQERQRTTSRGTTSRFTVTIDAKPIVHVIDTKELGRRPAEAVAEHLKLRIKNITEVASPATLKARKRNAEALKNGFQSAVARYSGGRTGTTPPNQSVRLFNDSGRLANGIFVRHGNNDEWVVNVPANRFDPKTLSGGQEALLGIFYRLQQLVPEFSQPAELFKVGSVKAAILDSYASILAKNERLTAQLAAAKRRVFNQILQGLTGG